MDQRFITLGAKAFGQIVTFFYEQATSKANSKRHLDSLDMAIAHAATMEQAIKRGDIPKDMGTRMMQGVPPMQAAIESRDVFPAEDVSREKQQQYSGVSQISAAGKACIPCGNDHFSTVSGLMAEALRFARTGGIAHKEVMLRISQAEDELNAFERIDGAPDKVVDLPEHEKEIMNAMLVSSRGFRHQLSEVKTVADLEALAAEVKRTREEYRAHIFGMQLAKS